MNNYIENLIRELPEINKLLAIPQKPEDITLDMAIQLASFFRDYSDTNRLIAEAVGLVRNNLDQLESLTHSLSDVLRVFPSDSMKVWEAVDYCLMVDEHIKPYKQLKEKAKSEAQRLWQVRMEKDHHLESLAYSSDETEDRDQLDDEFKKVDSDYKHASNEASVAFDNMREEERRTSNVYYLKASMFRLFIEELKEIVQDLMDDIDNLRKGGNDGNC